MRKIIKLAAIVGFASALPISAALADTSLNDDAAAAAAPQHFPPVVFTPGDGVVGLASPQIAAYEPGFLFQRRAPLIVEEQGQSPNETAAEEAMTPGY